ncbi:MAG: tetratricopeptide repeat protein [Flavobacteriaceae bacterium]
MRICSLIIGFVCTAGIATGALALDPSRPISPDSEPGDALRVGAQAYLSGDKQRAATALEVAAEKGHPLAQWKLGKMYASGDGVAEDDAKAFNLFRQIANQHAGDNPNAPMASVVSNAFVELGNYYRSGLESAGIQRNFSQALDLFTHAATYFGDPDAQYNLARMYLDGEGVSRDPSRAAKWLSLAARKNHVPSQALLGDMLLRGGEVPARPELGMMWLIIAKEHAEPKDRDWVLGLHFQARERLSPEIYSHAEALARDWMKRGG